MNIQNILQDVTAHKFRTRADYREMSEELFDRVLMGLVYVIGPIADQIERITNRICRWYENLPH